MEPEPKSETRWSIKLLGEYVDRGKCPICGDPLLWEPRLIMHHIGDVRICHIMGVRRHTTNQNNKMITWIRLWRMQNRMQNCYAVPIDSARILVYN